MEEKKTNVDLNAVLKKTTPWFIGVFVLLGVVIGIGFLSKGDRQKTANAFVSALREERYDDAFALCSEKLQGHLKNSEGLEEKVNPKAIPGWIFWTSFDGNDKRYTLRDSTKTWWSSWSVSVYLVREQDDWQVDRFSSGKDGESMKLQYPVKKQTSKNNAPPKKRPKVQE